MKDALKKDDFSWICGSFGFNFHLRDIASAANNNTIANLLQQTSLTHRTRLNRFYDAVGLLMTEAPEVWAAFAPVNEESHSLIDLYIRKSRSLPTNISQFVVALEQVWYNIGK